MRLLPVAVLLFLAGCQEPHHTYKEITMQAFSDMRMPAFVFDPQTIGRLLSDMAQTDKAACESDRRTCAFYRDSVHHLLWIDRAGADYRADSLLAYLRGVEAIGMTPRSFGVEAIESDLQRLRTLQFDGGTNDLNHVAARLEYRLTKACLRYAYGQRFGFVNPHRVFNHLDVEKEDSVRRITRYRGLFDMDMDLPEANYYETVFSKISHDSLTVYLREIQPQNAFYKRLQGMLPTTNDADQRQRILCNMERSRWRLKHPIPEQGKRIIVNIPAFHLYAYGQDSVLDMRVVCGAIATKTPQLTSEVEWMEVNPQWVIPMSILQKDVARRAGDSAYFARNRYQIYDKETNTVVPVGSVSRSMLLSGKYRVAQKSGSDNSLGRIVFRFKNRFSVYLHYTSSPWVFQREVRAISHGCVRVAKPFELAEFLLDNPDEWLLDRIRISMDLRPETDRGRQYLRTHADEKEHKLIGYVPVKPHVPVYVIYYTMWPDEQGVLQTWPDIYGYDRVLWNHLQTYMQ